MCEHKEKIEVSRLVYCKKCNQYLHPVLNPDIKTFVDKLNESLGRK